MSGVSAQMCTCMLLACVLCVFNDRLGVTPSACQACCNTPLQQRPRNASAICPPVPAALTTTLCSSFTTVALTTRDRGPQRSGNSGPQPPVR